ncbi:MAG: ATP-dependent helicase [Verrucomicrobiia bacterium]
MSSDKDNRDRYKVTRLRDTGARKIDYSRALNEQQYAAVTCGEGPSLVIAGAGSGKTRTLTYRVAYLVENGVPPDNLLLLTFTNKAAQEMMSRANSLVKTELSGLWGGTFHAVGARILKRFASKLGFKNDFTILDRDESETLIKHCIDEKKLEKFPKPSVLSEIFSKSINTEINIPALIEEEFSELAQHTDKIVELYKTYIKRKKENNVMDFDDLLYLWFVLLKNEQDVLEYYQKKFEYILVDEYQDTNKLQAQIIDLLAALRRNLMVVGDDSQSIYSWRGANFQNILEFPNRYPDAKIFKIEYNYRSTPEILEFANAVISKNKFQFQKRLAPVREHGVKPLIIVFDSVEDQAKFICNEVTRLTEKGINYSDIAVLYRSHFHTPELQLELAKQKIPYEILSGIRFYEQAHIKDVAAFIRLLSNPYDELSFRRIVEMLPGIGKKGAQNLYEQYKGLLSKQSSKQKAVLVQSTDYTPLQSDSSEEKPVKIKISDALKNCAIPSKTVEYWSKLINLFISLESPQYCDKPDRLILLISDSFYKEYLAENYENAKIRMEDIEQLAAFASGYSTVDEFLVSLSLLTNLEAEETRQAKKNQNCLRLSTIHQAKGLEFEVVFIIMMCDGFFPNDRSSLTIEGEEEERRLFYVAITRAKNLLYICYPQQRKRFGPRYLPMLQPSRFITDIPQNLYEGLKVTYVNDKEEPNYL